MSEHTQYSLKTIRKHINSTFFKPQMAKSFLYLIRDIGAVALISSATFFAVEFKQYLLAFVLAIINGNFFFALFVVGHDCGHGSFSRSKKVNNIVGFVTHHFLLTPYWAWKKSHAKHHRYSGNINKDESIVPFSQDEAQAALGVSPQNKSSFLKVRIFNLFIFITGINFHLYTVYNPRTKASHFWPNNAFLTPSDTKWILLGTFTTLITLGLLITLAYLNLPLFLLGYLLPILICYHLMGLVTLMQHHHVDSTWNYDNEWDYVTGALNTFDYRYGRLNSLIRHWHHNIANYHVVHHLFSSIPHYNLKSATEELANNDILSKPAKNFAYLDYIKIIWHCNFVDNHQDGQKNYKLKPFEDL